MASQIAEGTSHECFEEFSGLQSTSQNYEQLKTSKGVQSSLREPIIMNDEIKEANITDELINKMNCAEVMDKNNNCRNVCRQHIQPATHISEIKLEKSQVVKNSEMDSWNSRNSQNFTKNFQIPLLKQGDMNKLTRRYCNKFAPEIAKCHHSTYSHQTSRCCSVPSTIIKHNCRYCSNACDQTKHASCSDGKCKKNNYKSETTSVSCRNEPVKSKKDEATQTHNSLKIWQKTVHCSKPIYQQVQPKSNFKSNVYSRQKCICEGFREQSSQKIRHLKSSSKNARKAHVSNQVLSAPKHHRQVRCKPTVHVIAAPGHKHRFHDDVLKCQGCGRHIFRKYSNARSNDVHHYSTGHPHSNNRSSSGLRHMYYYK